MSSNATPMEGLIPPLVVRFGALGDMVMLTPMLKALADRYGHPCDVVASGSWSRSLYDGLPFVRHVDVIRSRKTPYILDPQQRGLVARLSERVRGPVWSLETLPKVDWLIERARYPESFVVNASRHPRRAGEHIVDYGVRLANIDPDGLQPREKIAPDSLRPVLSVTGAELDDYRSWCRDRNLDPRSVILVHPGNKRTMVGGWQRRPSNIKYWPDDRWAGVISELLEADGSVSVVINATPREIGLAEGIRRSLPVAKQPSAVIGDVPLRRLLAMLALARGCISTDSGPAHVAAAVGCPVVVLFGETNPQIYRPVGRPGSVRCVFSIKGEDFISEDGREWRPGATMSFISEHLVTEAWRQLVDDGLRDGERARG